MLLARHYIGIVNGEEDTARLPDNDAYLTVLNAIHPLRLNPTPEKMYISTHFSFFGESLFFNS
jgi:hypothetical protein